MANRDSFGNSVMLFGDSTKKSDFPIPIFHGNEGMSCLEWVTRVEEGKSTMNWDDATTAQHASVVLAGLAKQHAETCKAEAEASNVRNRMDCWVTMRPELMKMFGKRLTAMEIGVMKRNLVQGPNEKPSEFRIRVTAIVREGNQAIGIMKSQIYMDKHVPLPTADCTTCKVAYRCKECERCKRAYEMECFSWFLNGCRPDIRRRLEESPHINNMQEAVDHASSYYEAIMKNVRNVNEIIKIIPADERDSYIAKVNAMNGTGNNGGGGGAQARDDRQQASGGQWGTQEFKGRDRDKSGKWTCYWCNELTDKHTARNCPKKAKGVPKAKRVDALKKPGNEKVPEKTDAGNDDWRTAFDKTQEMIQSMGSAMKSINERIKSMSRPASPTGSEDFSWLDKKN